MLRETMDGRYSGMDDDIFDERTHAMLAPAAASSILERDPVTVTTPSDGYTGVRSLRWEVMRV